MDCLYSFNSDCLVRNVVGDTLSINDINHQIHKLVPTRLLLAYF